MSSKTPSRKAAKPSAAKHPPGWIDPLAPQQPLVSGRWLLSAIAIMLAAAAACAYGALCLLFYQGQWQMLFHPSRSVAQTPSSAGLHYDDIRFDYTETGLARLTGWWIPAAPNARYSADTILYLHDGKGSLSGCLPQLTALHRLGISVFAFDYRGFGKSSGAHPTERTANDDAAAAWSYLTDTRHLPVRSIAVYGRGTGATFAAALAVRYAPPAVILEDPNPPARVIFHADARARILPLWLLQNEFLDPAPALARLSTPKLFLDAGSAHARTAELCSAASDPKICSDLRGAGSDLRDETLRRFLDQVFAAPADTASRL
ncbi:alpha/beta hydrolase [Paracidobacterium acidisoli]|uniref:Alpha/beta fold hydrolase n=1 Tax=Paracidobacterium acidisoli TaxID=2303751 RepID=A0A372ISB1_9BACT|nr:alpha/beta fold hydrolase [Paracidobacterium acidisoli]MBT9330712.1 alpha/beta hydrolase [Paracidobacterium acidisoli]